MASVVVKTIWQSKEIHEAGDPPAGVESRSQVVPEAPGGVTSPAKGITKKKKAVSFHGWVCRTLSGTVLAPSTASNQPWVLEDGKGERRRGQLGGQEKRQGEEEGGRLEEEGKVRRRRRGEVKGEESRQREAEKKAGDEVGSSGAGGRRGQTHALGPTT
jgi:hypothetical protein